MRHIKLTCAAIVLVTVSSEAMAQSRPPTTAMSCNQAQSIVLSQGAVVLNMSATNDM
jgi:hypothetical protein